MKEAWALVTGGTGGIGAQLVRQLADSGYRPAIGYCSNKDAAEQLAKNYQGEAISLDLLDHGKIDAAVSVLANRPLEVLVLNAALPPEVAPFVHSSTEAIDRQYRVAVLGNQRLLSGIVSQIFRPLRSGTVIGVLSKAMGVAGSAVMKDVSSYVMTKYALLGMLTALQAEYRWLRVETVYPGFTDTPMLSAFDPRFVELLRERNAIAFPKAIAAEIMEKIKGSAK